MSLIRYSAQVQQHAVHRVIHSRTPIAQVARDVGCSITSIRDWLKKYQAQGLPIEAPSVATFVPISIVDSAQPSAEIVLPNGIAIRLTDASPGYLAELLQALIPSC